MSIQSSNIANLQLLPLIEPYTGTKDQPDSVSLFIKNANNLSPVKIFDDEFMNRLGHSPFEMSSAVVRIEKAVKVLLAGGNGERCNACKNLIRGFVQLVPLIGNLSLYAFDYVRTHFFFHSQIKAALASRNESIMGIAFDGKVVAEFSTESFKRCLRISEPRDDQALLNLLKYMWLKFLSQALQGNDSLNRQQLAEKLLHKFKAAQNSS